MPLFLFIFFLLLAAYAILIEYYRRGWTSVPDFIATGQAPNFISVVVAARNERENLPSLFLSLRNQVYPSDQFEVIVVDDHSTDHTWELISEEQQNCGNVRGIRYDDPHDAVSFKKKAIELGVRAAKGKLIVCTDADCTHHPQWLQTLNDFYSERQSKFIVAPVRMVGPGSLLTIFQTLDFVTLQGITAAAVQNRFHSMCNGANLAYEQLAFEKVGGFADIHHVISGDDMLLMHKIFEKYPHAVHYLKSERAIVSTPVQATLSSFLSQRVRWASKATQYGDKRIFWVLLLVYLVNLGYLILAVASFWDLTWLFFLVLLLVAKTLVEFPFVKSVAHFFGQQRMMVYFPWLQPVHVVYIVLAGLWGRIGFEWKGRKVGVKTA